jgi:hypothetical protein
MTPLLKSFTLLGAVALDLALWAGSSLAAGLIAAGPTVAAEPHLAPDSTWVPLGVFGGALVVLVPLIWWAGRTFQKMCDDLAFVKKRLRELRCSRRPEAACQTDEPNA